MAVTTKYTVKVPLDLGATPGSDQSVIWDESEKEFALGTGTGITINNHADNRITTATSDPNTLNAESYFRHVATGLGTGQGKVDIGSSVAQLAAPYQLLTIGNSLYTSQLIVHSLSGDDPFVRFGLNDLNASVIGFGAKNNASNRKFQIGTYVDQTDTVFTPYLSMNHAGRIGIGEGPSPVLGKSYIDSNWGLFTTRAVLNTTAQDEDEWVSVTAFQNSETGVTKATKVLQLYAGAPVSNFPESTTPGIRFIEFYARNDINENYLLGHISANNYPWANPGVEIYSVSDKRLKKDIKTLSVGLDKLLKIQPVEYKWKINKGKGYDKGFIAQDLHKIYPEAVQVPLTDNAEKDPWTISPTKLIPLLVKSIQDQQEIIKKLENRINNLENKIK